MLVWSDAKRAVTNKLFLGIIIGISFSYFVGDIFKSEIKMSDNENEIAEEMIQKVRVLCWVMTKPSNHRTKAIHVKRTWGRRCNKFILISSVEDKTIGTIGLKNVSEGRSKLWAKTKEGFKYVWANHRHDAEWFLKADDDTYVVVENLRKFLYKKSSTEPIYFGCHFSSKGIPSWASGGAGYVLSKEALWRFVENALPNPEKCKSADRGAEDAEMGKCLTRVGVHLGDTRDEFGRHRFLANSPSSHVFPKKKASTWYWKALLYPQVQGMDCCANDAISFHYVSGRDQYALEYLLYHLRPHGVNKEVRYVQEYPLEITSDFWKKMLPDQA